MENETNKALCAPISDEERISRARNFLSGYQMCVDMLHLRRYERRRAKGFEENCDCDDLLACDEVFWRARMYQIKTLIDSMRNGREKALLYYHYISGESIDRAADLLDISRRTGYRLHQRALLTMSFLIDRFQKSGGLEA
jgi:DNA-directed RNA polymerase specialized sigma24 family protein